MRLIAVLVILVPATVQCASFTKGQDFYNIVKVVNQMNTTWQVFLFLDQAEYV